MDNVCTYRQELESVTLKLQLQICRYCEKTTDSQPVVAAGPVSVHGPCDQLPQSREQPRMSSAEFNSQQSQQQPEIPARLYFTLFFSNLSLI